MPLPRIILPILVALALTGGFTLRNLFTRPTLTWTVADRPGEKAVFVVDGLRCRGTAQFLASLYENTPGILSIQAFATERKAVFTFDPRVISRDRIRGIMEAPVPFNDGTTGQVFRCLSVDPAR